jgi:hypothetical protein
VGCVSRADGHRFRTPAWLWPNILSLDAPLVAVLWQVLLARSIGIHVDPYELPLLAGAVWLVYFSDRVLDALRTPPGNWEPVRQRFYRRHCRAASFVLFAASLSIVPLAATLLRPAVFRAGLSLALIVGVYFVVVHAAPQCWRVRWPREFVVAVIFTAGTFLALWIGAGDAFLRLAGSAVLFALLCWVNCSAIEFWEWQSAARLPWTTRYLGKYVSAICACITAIAAFLELARLAPGAVCIAVVLSGASFGMLARWRSRLSPELLRVAADLALCTPLLVLPFLW